MIALTRLAAAASALAVVAATVWPFAAGGTVPLPEWAGIPFPLKLAMIFLVPAVWFASLGDDGLARRLGAAGCVLAAAMLASWIVAQSFPGVAPRWLSLKSGPLTAIGFGALMGALWQWRTGNERSDSAAVLASGALCVFFLVLIGHLFGAEALTDGSTPAATVLLFGLSLGLLSLHSGGPLAAYEGPGPGPVAKRRLLPAAVLTPIATGYLLVYAIESQQLGATLAVALAVFANVLVMLLLIHGAGNKVERVAQDRQARVEARVALARKQGMRDAMTGTLNRRGWDAEVQSAERRCRAEHLDACVLVIDLDGLKQVNDTEGHKAGDAYIQRAAGALRRAARRGDALARVGGDEFAYLVTGCDEEDARAVVKRFEDSLRMSKVSAAVGYAMRGRRSIAGAFDEADRVMYERKRAGRQRRPNRVA